MALANRRPLTSRQAVRKVIKETTLASHFMVRFVDDQAVSVVSSKHIVEPPPTNLKVLSECTVKWSDDNTYKATVLSMGKEVTCILYSFNMCMFLYVGNEKEMRKAESNLLKPGRSDSENCTPTQKRQREDNSENGPVPKKARKSTKGTPTTTKMTPAAKYNYKEVWNTVNFTMHVTL